MNNTSEVVTLSVIALIWVAPVKNGWLLKLPKKPRDRQVYFALVTCFCACAQKQRIPLIKKIMITSLIVKLKI